MNKENKTEDAIYIIETTALKEKDFNDFNIKTIGKYSIVKP